MDVQVEKASRFVADGDWDALTGVLADEFFGYSPRADEPTAAGRLVEILADLRNAIPDLKIEVGDLTEGDASTTGVFSMSGTHSNPLWGAPGSGNRISWTSPVTLRLVDDRVAVRFDDVSFPDLIAVLRQFGLVNPPERMDEPPPHPVSIPEFVLKLMMTGQAGDKDCSHLDEINFTEPNTRLCEQCYVRGVNWPALRMCLTCGFVGCCDTSKNKHMMKHHEETGHPLMRSIRMDEGWAWCYGDDAFFEKATLDRYNKT